jgi:hypothetical protein
MKRSTTMKAAAVLTAAGLTGILSLCPTRASACGVSAAGVPFCSLAEHDEAERPKWAVGVSGLYTSTALHLSDSFPADQIRYATLATLAYMPTPKLILQAGAGATLGGSLTLPDGQHDFSPGPTASIGADWRAFDDRRTFVLLTAALSFSAARTHLGDQGTVGYEAFDLRLGGQAGLDIANVFQPYVVVRAFGGPVYWNYMGNAVTGTDAHHYQVGAGAGLRVSKVVNLFVEGIPIGERAVSLGAGVAI